MTTTDANPDWWRDTDDDRVAERRAQTLRQLTPWGDGNRPVALALAYRRLGYSYSGIAGRIDKTEATVAGYMDEVADEYGEHAVYTALPADLAEWPDGPFPPEGENR